MTLPATTRRAGPFNGNGVTTAFPFTFKVFATSDLKVVKAVSGVESTLVLNSDYTVTLNGDQDANPGGTVTYASLASGQTLSIAGALVYDQPLDLPSGGNFSPIALENELDRLTMQVQQVAETAGRALTVPITSTASSALPAPEANKIIAWNETASALENLSANELATVVAYGTAASNIFTGTGAQTAFVLTYNPGALNNLDISIGGVTQLPGIDYTWSSGTTVTFTSAPPLGAKVLIRYMQALALGTADAGSVQYLPAGVSAVPTTVQAKLRESVSVLDFGADPTGVASSSAAIVSAQNYLASTGGGTLYFPAGEYKVTTPIVMKPGITYCGPMKAGLGEHNPGRSRIFSSTNHIFTNAATVITEVCFRDIFIESEMGGGHVFDWSNTGLVAKIEMSGVCLAQRNANKCVIYGVAAGGVFSIWMHDFEYVYVATCTYPQVWIASQTVNSIVIENFWSTSNGESASGNLSILIESTNPAGQAFNVAIRQGVFELPGGGSVRLLSCTNSVIEECAVYDLSIIPGYYQFSVDKGAGPASSAVTIRNCRSTVGSATHADLFINMSVAGQGRFLIEGCTFSYTAGAAVNTGAQVEVVNSGLGTVSNFSYTEVNNGAESNLRFYNPAVTSADVSFWNGYSGNRDGALNIKVNGTHSGSISKTGVFSWGAAYILQNGTINAGAQMYPGTPLSTVQASCGLLAGSGAPSAAGGVNGDFYFRSDGGALTSIYHKRAGSWVGIV